MPPNAATVAGMGGAGVEGDRIEIAREVSRAPTWLAASAGACAIAAAGAAIAGLAFGHEPAVPAVPGFVLCAVTFLVVRAFAFKSLVVSHSSVRRTLFVDLVALRASHAEYTFADRPTVDLKYVHVASSADAPDPPSVYRIVVRGSPRGFEIERPFVKKTCNRIANAIRAAIDTWPDR